MPHKKIAIPEKCILSEQSARLLNNFGLAKQDRGTIDKSFMERLLRRNLIVVEIGIHDKWVYVTATKLGERYLFKHAFEIDQRKRFGYLKDKHAT